jgi:acetolactate synthase-1/2/3 large subunit
LPILDTRHEVAAGHAAEGYARAADRLGVALVTAGPGFTNVVTSIANAFLDRTPVLYISGAAGLGQAQTNTLQAGIDQPSIARPITKWTHQIAVTADIPRLVAQAIRTALSGPRGPVLLDIPMDVLGGRIDEEAVAIPDFAPRDEPAPSAGAVAEALALLRAAERPVIMLGGGLRLAAADAVRRLAEASGIPVFSDFAAHGLLPSDHPLYGGTFHKMADLETERPDVILALGVRFGLFTLGTTGLVVPRDARIIHVEIDPREIGLVLPVELPIVADPTATVAALADTVTDWPSRDTWQATIRAA